MPKQPRLRAQEAEAILLRAGFELIRTQGSHRIYKRDETRIVVPFHTGKVLHPKIVRQVMNAVEAAE